MYNPNGPAGGLTNSMTCDPLGSRESSRPTLRPWLGNVTSVSDEPLCGLLYSPITLADLCLFEADRVE